LRRAGGPTGLRLEVFQHLFASVAEEMGAALMRSAFSANVKERRDFSCAIFDGHGRMIGQAAHLPIHLGSTPLSVAAAIEYTAMGPGDAVLLNDPFAGGTHLPDLTLVSPVFLPGRSRPDFFCANRAHHADVGGAWPGSMAPTHDVHGEGIRIPPVHFIRAGEVVPEILALLLANMRVPVERHGDLMAQWSANRLGAQRLCRMAADHGRRQILEHAEGLMAWTEALVRTLLKSLPRGVFKGETHLDEDLDGGAGGCIRVRCKMHKSTLICDFTATDDSSASHLNTVRAVTISAVMYVLRLLLPPGTPVNGGIMGPIEVRTRPGSLVDAAYPTAVAAGNVESSQRIVDVLLDAFAEALPGRIPAASAGTMSNVTIGGVRADGRPFAHYETIAGGAGGGPAGHGAHGIQTHMTNTRNTPIEALELDTPIRVTRLGIRRASGGRGRFRGGDGVVKQFKILAPAHVSWVAERQAEGPPGRDGGGPGKPGSARTKALAARSCRLQGKATLGLQKGTMIEIRTPGGGGSGFPLSAQGAG